MVMTRRALGVLIALLALAVAAAPFSAGAMESKLVIVTSYPPDTTNTVKAAFEKKHPGIKVEMLRKKTTAGIKYLQETAGNNRSDMFWASAPDAFEVLKGDSLLQKYEVQVQGIPEKVGAFPINDPEGYYKGFAASGYGIMWNTRYLKAKKLPVPKTWADLAKPVYHGHVGMSAPVPVGHHAPDRGDLAPGPGLGEGLGHLEGHRRQLQDRDRAKLRRPRRRQHGPVRHRHRHRLLRVVVGGPRASR